MKTARRVRVTVTLPEDLLERIDRQAAQAERSSRSAVIERWLRQAGRRQAEAELERATIAYFDSLSEEERAEDEVRSAALSVAARRLDIDGDRDDATERAPSPRRRRRPRS